MTEDRKNTTLISPQDTSARVAWSTFKARDILQKFISLQQRYSLALKVKKKKKIEKEKEEEIIRNNLS